MDTSSGVSVKEVLSVEEKLQPMNEAVRAPMAGTEHRKKPYVLTELLSFRIRRIANLMSSTATLMYRRQFDLSLAEWRLLGLLGVTQPMTVNRLARLAALDKAQVSRGVTYLVEQGYVRKETGPRRSSQLTLSAEGQALYEQVIRTANDRDQSILSVLTAEEWQVLDVALDKLTTRAVELYEREEAEEA